MWLFERYIVKEFLERFLISLIVLISVFLGVEILTRIWDINAPFSVVFSYYMFRIPSVMVQLLPVSILFSTLLLFTYLSKHNELVALYCSGRSLVRIAMPVFGCILFICIASYQISDKLVPVFNFKAKKIWMVDILKRGQEFYGSLSKEAVWFRGPGFIYNVKASDSATSTLSSVNIYYFDDAFNMVQHIYANKAVYSDGKWELMDGKVSIFDSAGDTATKRFEKKVLQLKEKPQDFKGLETATDYLSADQLGKSISELKLMGVDPCKYEVEYHKRYSMAFTGLIMGIIGLPFAIRQHRRGGVALNIGISFLIVLVYWLLFSVLLSMGISGRIDAVTSSWGANAVFALFALVLIHKQKK